MLHSYLYVPGDRPDLMSKAVAGPAHAVILDLEDGVAPAAADVARRHVEEFLSAHDASTGPTLAVRLLPERLDQDIRLAVAGGVKLLYLPKAELGSIDQCAAVLDEIDRRGAGDGSGGEAGGEAGAQGLGTPGSAIGLVGLVETAQGLLDVEAVARHHRVIGLALGESDLFAELGVAHDLEESERTSLRLRLVVASAAAGLRGPTAPASIDYRDLDRFRASCEGLRRLGFSARSAVHPAQVPVINEVFAPTPAEVERARALVAAFDAAVARGTGVIVGEDGRMIDAAVVRSARRLLD